MEKLSFAQKVLLFTAAAIVVWMIVLGFTLSRSVEQGIRDRAGVSGGTEEPVVQQALVAAEKRIVWRNVGGGGLILACLVLGTMFAALRRSERQARELEEMSLQFITSMVNAVDAQNPWTHGHSERTARYALRIGRRLGLSRDMLEDLRYAALLHDLGNVGAYDRTAEKPDALTEAEQEEVKQQPNRGEKILEGVNNLRRILPVMRSHRERYDGTGYPDSRGGEAIPLLARIVHVAEAYDAMVEDRPYRAGSGLKYAREELIRNSGTQFDPQVVDAFLKVLASDERSGR